MKPTPLTARTARARAKAALKRHESKKHVLTGGHDVPHAKRWDCTKQCAVFHAEWHSLIQRREDAHGQDFRDTPTFVEPAPTAEKPVYRSCATRPNGTCSHPDCTCRPAPRAKAPTAEQNAKWDELAKGHWGDVVAGVPSPTGMHVVLVGDIVSGFDAYGPFYSGHDAVTWHQQKGNRELTQGQWFIMPLKAAHAEWMREHRDDPDQRSEEPT